MLKEFFDGVMEAGRKAAGLQVAKLEDGRLYAVIGGKYQPLEPQQFPNLLFSTLTGLVDYIKANRDGLTLGEAVVAVNAHDRVYLIGREYGPFRARDHFAGAAFTAPAAFPAGSWLPQDEFCIKVQSMFVASPERARLLKIAGSVAAGHTRTLDDDGVTQQVQTKVGATLKGTDRVDNPFHLAPFRTFHEVLQPESTYILRVKSAEGCTPTFALFDADGGAWKNEAIRNVRNYLKHELAGVDVVVLA